MTNESVVRVVKFRLGEIDEELDAAKRKLKAALGTVEKLQSEVDELTAGANDLREWLELDGGIKPVGESLA